MNMASDVLISRSITEMSEVDGAIDPRKASRIHYLDNLRALAMLLGVYLHAALAYAEPAQQVWLATDTRSSVAIDASIWFIHLFRMGLFFLLSGYFAKRVIDRKGANHFLWNRCVRIVLPFVLFYPFLLAAMTIAIVFALSYLDEPQGLMKLITESVKANKKERQPLTTMHLWFLYYLMLFSCLAWFLTRAKWLSFRKRSWRNGMLFLFPLLLVPSVMNAGMPLPAPESFLPQWWPVVFYGLFFYTGWQLVGREVYLHAWSRHVWSFLLGSIVLYIPYYWLLPVLDLNIVGDRTASQGIWVRLLEAMLTAYLSVSLTLVSLLLGLRYLNWQSPKLRVLADASYWIYLVHLPIVIFLQTLMVPVAMPAAVKLGAVLVGTMVACMASYIVFVRYTPVGWMLHGKRSFP